MNALSSLYMIPSNGDLNFLNLHVTMYYKHDKVWRSFHFAQKGWSSTNVVDLYSVLLCLLMGWALATLRYFIVFFSYSR